MRFNRIKGEDRPHNAIRLPMLGRIKLGVKKKKGRPDTRCKHRPDEDCVFCTFPTETDYFVCPPEVQEAYGEKPQQIPVMLPVEDEDKFFRQFYAVYGGNQKIKCIGNGEVCERTSDGGKKEELPCPHPENCDFGKKFRCHARTIIQVVIPAVGMGGVYQISTGSINSDIDVRSGIEMARYLFGRISYVPMIMKREHKLIPDPATGKMQNHWPIKLFPQATPEEANLIRSDNTRIIEHQKRFALPEPIIEGPQADTPMEVIEGEVVEDTSAETIIQGWRDMIEGCKTTGALKTAWEEIMAKRKSGVIGLPEYNDLALLKDGQKTKIDASSLFRSENPQ